MARLKPPIVAVLGRCRVRYAGRAVARQTGGTLVVLVKDDGSVSVHGLLGGVKPQFYNPAGEATVVRRGERLVVKAASKTGEELMVSGVPEVVHEVGDAAVEPSPPRRRVSGMERDLVGWIQERPQLVGLGEHPSSREVGLVGGRVDLRFGEVIVEVKRRAILRDFDQALRYLRDPTVESVVIACLGASRSLVSLCEAEERVELVVLEDGLFHEWLSQR